MPSGNFAKNEYRVPRVQELDCSVFPYRGEFPFYAIFETRARLKRVKASGRRDVLDYGVFFLQKAERYPFEYLYLLLFFLPL